MTSWSAGAGRAPVSGGLASPRGLAAELPQCRRVAAGGSAGGWAAGEGKGAGPGTHPRRGK